MREQGAQENALEDTVLLVGSLISDPWIDVSQFLTDLTGEDELYEEPSGRAAITGATGRELYIRLELANTDTNTEILVHADTAAIASNTYRIRLDLSLNIVFLQGSTTIYSVASGIGITPQELSIHWSTRANPDTTGAGDAQISEFVIYNHTGTAYVGEIVQVAHAVSTTNVAWGLTLGGFWDGATVTLVSSLTVAACRIGRAFHTSCEFAEDWIAARTAPTADANALEYLLPLTQASEIGDDGEWVGQANIGWIAEDNARKRRALWSPLVNVVFSDAEAFAKTPDDPVPWVRLAPGSALYEMRLDWLRWVAVPSACTHARVWVQLVSYVTSSTAVPIQLRFYAMNRTEELSLDVYPGAPEFAYAYATSALHTVNDTSGGVGQWLELGLLPLPIYDAPTTGFKDTVHLCLAYAFDPLSTSGNDANARLRVRAIHVRPVFSPVPQKMGE